MTRSELEQVQKEQAELSIKVKEAETTKIQQEASQAKVKARIIELSDLNDDLIKINGGL